MHISRSRSKDSGWYLGVACRYCESPILFGRDTSEGRAVPQPHSRLVLTCADPECGRQADYSGTCVSRYRKEDNRAVLLGASK